MAYSLLLTLIDDEKVGWKANLAGAISGEGEEISLDAGRRMRETTMTEFTDRAVNFCLRLLENVESVYVSELFTVISQKRFESFFSISAS